MSLRDEIQFALDEINRSKTDEVKHSAARRIVAGWTQHYIQAVREDLIYARSAAAGYLKRAVNEKTGLRIFDVGGKR